MDWNSGNRSVAWFPHAMIWYNRGSVEDPPPLAKLIFQESSSSDSYKVSRNLSLPKQWSVIKLSWVCDAHALSLHPGMRRDNFHIFTPTLRLHAYCFSQISLSVVNTVISSPARGSNSSPHWMNFVPRMGGWLGKMYCWVFLTNGNIAPGQGSNPRTITIFQSYELGVTWDATLPTTGIFH